MAFIKSVLQEPSYGWCNANGDLVKPTPRQLLAEFVRKQNVFRCRKNWLPFFGWACILLLFPAFVAFVVLQVQHFNVWLLVAAFLYGMVAMGTHGTIWYHRYCTHHAYVFKNRFWRFVTANLVLKLIPEETYVVSHHVHHALSDMPGDPYNANGGFLYCFLADVNHQPIAKNLSAANYQRVVQMFKHTGSTVHGYEQYRKWGSASAPLPTILGTFANWIFWFAVFYALGGLNLAIAIFAGAFVWGVGVRTFNYEGHAKGKTKHADGSDFNRNDNSINQLWPGIVAGEWHNNHHLYPNSARSGFLPHQVDFAWVYIRLLHVAGGVSSYRDDKAAFLKDYKQPYEAGRNR